MNEAPVPESESGHPVLEIPHLTADAPHHLPPIHEPPRDPFRRVLIVRIVTATLLSAAVAVLHSYAMSRGERAAYLDAVRRTRFANTQETMERTPTDLRDRAVTVMTDLEILLARRWDLKEEITKRKEWLVANTWPGPRGAFMPHEVHIVDLDARISPTAAQWVARLENFDRATDALVVVWYVSTPYNPHSRVWSGLPRISGWAQPDQLKSEDDGRVSHTKDYLPDPPECLQSGRYRVEFYVNGRLTETRIIKTELPDLRAEELSDLTLRMCHPADWQRYPKSRFGLVSGYTDDGHSRGAFLFRFRHPWGAETAPRVMDEHIRAYVRWAFHYVGLPQDAKLERTFDKASFLGSGFKLTHSRRASYTYRGGRILTGVGVSEAGSVVIGVVYGPEPTHILDSMR